MAIKLFISHSASDEKLARALISLLKANFYFSDWQVRSTSLEMYDPTDEALATGRLSQELRHAKLVIFILTPFSGEAGWLRLELALTWASHNDSVLLLTAGLHFKNLPREFPKRAIIKIHDQDDAQKLANRIGRKFQWERKPEMGETGRP
jgi:hypothetical protein